MKNKRYKTTESGQKPVQRVPVNNQTIPVNNLHDECQPIG